MIRYNWGIIKKRSKHDLRKILAYMDAVYLKRGNLQEFILKNKYAREIILDSKGTIPMSYIKNYEAFRKNARNGTEQEMLVYLDLVSKRDLFTYLNSKEKINYVPIWYIVDEYDIEKLKTNRLLIIDESNIYFIYEGE